MTITLEPAQAAHPELNRRAIAQSSNWEVYAANLLAESVQGPSHRPALTESHINLTPTVMASEMAQ